MDEVDIVETHFANVFYHLSQQSSLSFHIEKLYVSVDQCLYVKKRLN